MTTPLAIDCRHLTHRYGQFTAVDDLSLQVRCGETVGLLGPNGAGKTTVVRVLTTLTPVQSGEVYIFGLDARRHTMDIRHNIGYVPQQLSIEAALTGRQNVELFARLYDVPRRRRSDRVDEALDAMQLLDVADAVAGTYSVGMDPTARDSVWAQVELMQREFGMTVLLTTHYMQEADALCDRVALMHHGRLQAVGSPAELKRMVSAQAHVAASAAQAHVAASAAPAATLEDVFRHYAGSDLGEDTSQTGLRAVRNSRRTARRVS